MRRKWLLLSTILKVTQGILEEMLLRVSSTLRRMWGLEGGEEMVTGTPEERQQKHRVLTLTQPSHTDFIDM